MDIFPDNTAPSSSAADVALSYDDTVPYAELPPQPATSETAHSSLADRIGHTKVYLISDATATRAGKRKYEEEEEELDEMEEDVSDPSLRDNAILFQGSPISHLPTDNIFAYATHFDAHPIAMEWIDDSTCILVFSTKSAARGAFRYLAKSHAEEPSEEGFITSKPIPIALWPPKERIDKSLGMGEGLKGAIRMRWALTSDVKKRGAKKESQYYKKHGITAGREGAGSSESRPTKRWRTDEEEMSPEARKAQLDAEMDAFLAEDDDNPPQTAIATFKNALRLHQSSREDFARADFSSPPASCISGVSSYRQSTVAWWQGSLRGGLRHKAR
ncbi:hypothetical protein NM688_g7710 [Phlebia brevispora]|uniref:Uncharacterized protein n=1 Tax=Phlebia brevispora TaxID=194682 RepID=A0ACC1S201_9APHY|nr:hypothetical protein NM688_g7710 [Phlebia brevispora]